MLRAFLFAPLAAALLVPSAASARGEAAEPANELAGRLADPATQIAVTAMLAAMSEALLDFRVGPFARAAGTASGDGGLADLPPDARLRDVAGPDAARMTETISRQTPRMMSSMAAMAGSLAEMMPRMKDMARRMRQSLPAADPGD